MASSEAQAVPILGRSDSSQIMISTTCTPQPYVPTPVMVPISVNIQPRLPGQLDPGQTKFMPAQVSSVNVNTGGNMATKGPLMRPMHHGAPNVSTAMVDMSSAMTMHHALGVEGQATSSTTSPKVCSIVLAYALCQCIVVKITYDFVSFLFRSGKIKTKAKEA